MASSSVSFTFDLVRGFHVPVVDERRQLCTPSLDLTQLCPFLRCLVTTDGSVTRYLESATWEPVRVEVVEHGEATSASGAPVLRRVVVMRGVHSDLLLAAAETEMPLELIPDAFRPLLIDARRGIGEVISMLQLDTHRRIRLLAREPAARWASLLELGDGSPIIVRDYEIKREQQAFAYIREVFPEERLHALGTRIHRKAAQQW